MQWEVYNFTYVVFLPKNVSLKFNHKEINKSRLWETLQDNQHGLLKKCQWQKKKWGEKMF